MARSSIGTSFGRLVLLSCLLLALVPTILSCSSSPKVIVSASPDRSATRSSRIGVVGIACADAGFGDTVCDALSNTLLSNGCHVVERTYIAQLLLEQGIQVAGLTQASDVPRVGQLANVDYVLVGSVSVDNQYRVSVVGKYGSAGNVQVVSGASARLVDSRSGEVVLSVMYAPGRGSGWHLPLVIGEQLALAISERLK